MRRLLAIPIFLLAAAATLLGLDLWLQWAQVATPLENRADPRLGPVYRPGVEFSRFSEGFFLGGANAWGFLGTGAPPARQGEELRILLLGDSFVLGHTVLERHHFKTRLARDLTRRLGREVVVLNFARADYSLWNMHQHYVEHASAWDHDLALFFTADGDLLSPRPADPAMYPYTEASGDSLRINRDFRHSAKRRLYVQLEPVLTRLAMPRLGFNLLKIIDSGQWQPVLLGRFAPEPADDPGVQRGDVPGPLPPEVLARPAPPLPQTTLAILDDLAARPRCVVVLPWRIRPDFAAAVRASGVATLDATPVWAELRERGIDPWWWPVTGRHGHWNQTAHAALGAWLAEQILARGWLAGGEAATAPPR
jgi:hypothetical protein